MEYITIHIKIRISSVEPYLRVAAPRLDPRLGELSLGASLGASLAALAALAALAGASGAQLFASFLLLGWLFWLLFWLIFFAVVVASSVGLLILSSSTNLQLIFNLVWLLAHLVGQEALLVEVRSRVLEDAV